MHQSVQLSFFFFFHLCSQCRESHATLHRLDLNKHISDKMCEQLYSRLIISTIRQHICYI